MIMHMQLHGKSFSVFLFFPFQFWLFAAKRRQRRGRKSGGKEKRKIAQPF